MSLYERRRNLVHRADGRPVNVARSRGQLFVCAENCCCGRIEDGFAPVPVDLYHGEWERRRLRNIVHLTIGGCLGPCALANVALLLFDGQALWFHSVNSDETILALYDYIEAMLDADRFLPPPPSLVHHQFTAHTWQPRPDGGPVDDIRQWEQRKAARADLTPRPPSLARKGVPRQMAAERATDGLSQPPKLAPASRPGAPFPAREGGRGVRYDAPRKNGELVFEEPWESRAFGMAVALNEGQCYAWDDFRDRLIAQIAAADARDDPSGYYERWLAAFEQLLTEQGIVTKDELDERTLEFEFGERDEVF